jgi:hypothetical protein
MIDLQEQFDIIALRDELNKLIDGDNASGLSMKIYDILDILYKTLDKK